MKLLLLLFFLLTSLFAEKPDLLLLSNYKEDSNVTEWYMSEKLDGVRAYWDGKRLVSRSGKIFSVPSFFTENFPKFKLDGELWTKENDFSHIVSIVNKKKEHHGWSQVTYNIFEVPNVDGNLLKRLQKVKENKYIKKIKQVRVKNKKHLLSFLKEVESKAGEGIVVRDASLKYYTGRTNKALKVKSYKDAECEVVGYNKGQGKYKDMLGSLSCRMKNIKVIKVGSGLSDNQRLFPPKIGAVITFKYYGLTSKGNPRFPIFLRVQEK